MSNKYMQQYMDETTNKYREYTATGNKDLLNSVIHDLEQFLSISPHNADILHFLMEAYLYTENKNGVVIHLANSLLTANSRDFFALFFLGVAYRKENFDDLAKQAWEEALKLPQAKEGGKEERIFSAMAGLYADSGEPKKAIYWCDKVLSNHPEDTQALWHKSLALLTQRKWDSGFEIYGHRKNLPAWDSRKQLEVPLWDGNTDVSCIYVHGEQGVGDEVMFSAAIPILLDMMPNTRFYLEFNKKVSDWARYNFSSENVKVISSLKELTEEDKVCIKAKIPLGDLFGNNLPIQKGWLGEDKNKWKVVKESGYLKVPDGLVRFYKEKLKKIGNPPYIAIAWTGGHKGTRVESRSYDLECYKHIVDKYSCVSVQYNTHKPLVDQQVKEIGLAVIDSQSAGDCLMHQAALLKAVDLTITCQQTVVHVAGAVGAKAKVFLPHNPQWRYGSEGAYLPFYGKHVEMFRKPKSVHWDVFIKTKTQAIEKWLGRKSS